MSPQERVLAWSALSQHTKACTCSLVHTAHASDTRAYSKLHTITNVRQSVCALLSASHRPHILVQGHSAEPQQHPSLSAQQASTVAAAMSSGGSASGGAMQPPPFLRVEKREGGYALVVLCREPVNTMNLAFWQQLTDTLGALEADPAVRGIIFLSGLKRDVFTAGNDINELYAPLTTRERYREFWLVSNKFLARLYTSPLVTIAAIRGACPAGGCCVSMCCDYRIMTEEGSIGLNEVALGISVPKMWGALMARIIGTGPAERLLQFAAMLAPGEARRLGLVDEVVPKQELQAAAEASMARMLKSPDFSRAETKRLLHADFAREWVAYADPEADGAWRLLTSPPVVKQLGAVMERLSGKKPATGAVAVTEEQQEGKGRSRL